MGKTLKRKGDKNMKKMRKIFAVLLTLAMVLGMSMTSFAAKAGATLEVKGLATYAKQKVDIYEIYKTYTRHDCPSRDSCSVHRICLRLCMQ